MFVVMFGLFMIFCAIIVVVAAGASIASSRLKKEIGQREQEEAQIRKVEEDIVLLSVPGQPLICLGCQGRFFGPMPEDGCPNCRIASLVVPDRPGIGEVNNGKGVN